jgi:hypothetical protein
MPEKLEETLSETSSPVGKVLQDLPPLPRKDLSEI